MHSVPVEALKQSLKIFICCPSSRQSLAPRTNSQNFKNTSKPTDASHFIISQEPTVFVKYGSQMEQSDLLPIQAGRLKEVN